MQTRPQHWQELLNSNYKVEWRYIINSVEYTASYIQGTPTIEKPLMLEPVIGRCCTGTFTITVRKIPGVTIPKAAQVLVSCRLSSLDGQTITDWVKQGNYWIIHRSGKGDLLTLTCRDNMILAGRTYADKTLIANWPAPMADVVTEIASLMGTTVDPRSALLSGGIYVCDYPNEDMLMSEVLSMIAASQGGNFIITEAGKLRFIRFPDTCDPVTDLKQAFTSYTPYYTGSQTISRITLTDDADNQYTVGDDTGLELTCECFYAKQAMLNALASGFKLKNGTLYINDNTWTIVNGSLKIPDYSGATDDNNCFNITGIESIIGRSFYPFRIDGAHFDPLVELGDTFTATYRGQQLILIANTITVRCSIFYACSIENGVEQNDEEEVPYVSPTDLKASRYISAAYSYYGNRLNRREGFVSEYIENEQVVARLIANSNLIALQRRHNNQWESVLYFDAVTQQYKFTGTIDIDTTGFKAHAVSVDNNSLVFAADPDGAVSVSTHIVNVIAYQGEDAVDPVVSLVTGWPGSVSPVIGTVDQNHKLPITFATVNGEKLGSNDSVNGQITITVTSPVQTTIAVNWCKVNTGADGNSGISQTVLHLYQRANSQPANPANALSYTFSTDTLTGDKGSWLRTIPNGSSPCWTTSVSISSANNTVSIPAANWSTVVKLVENGDDGDDGYNSAVIHLYKRAAAAPALPVDDLVYVFVTGSLAGDLEGWSTQIPASNGDPCWVTSAQVITRNATATLESGRTILNGTLNLGVGAITGGTLTIESANVSFTDDWSMLITAGDWSTVVKLVEDGTDGQNLKTYWQAEAPEGIDFNDGDLWVDSSNGNKLMRWNISNLAWESIQDLNIPSLVTQMATAKARLDVLNEQISSAVDTTYVTNQLDSLIRAFNSTITQKANELLASFSQSITSATGAVTAKYDAYIRASGDGIELGRSDSNFLCRLNNSRLSFIQTDGVTETMVAYFSNNKLYITNAQITNELLIGEGESMLFKFVRTATGLGLKYVS